MNARTWILALGWIASSALGDTIDWDSLRGTVTKPVDDASASFQVTTATNAVTFTLSNEGASKSMFGFSQWEAERWPAAPPFDGGQFNVVTNANNDIVLGTWGFWGEEGAGLSTIPERGDFVVHRLTISFAQPVITADFQVNTINALIKPNGLNSNDALVVQGFLGSNAVPSPQYFNEGTAYQRTGDILVGDFYNRLPVEDPGQHISDGGSFTLSFSSPLDRIELTLFNTADHFDPAQFQSGYDDPGTAQVERLQTWAFSVNDVGFTTVPEPASISLALAAFGLAGRRRRRTRRG